VGFLKGFGAIRGCQYIETALFEIKLNQFYRLRFVVNDEDLWSHIHLDTTIRQGVTMAAL
jgi:hypothetical protein